MYMPGCGELNEMVKGILDAPAGPGSDRISHPKEKNDTPVTKAPGSAGLLKVAVSPWLLSANVVPVPTGTSPLINVPCANNAVPHTRMTAKAAILLPDLEF